MGGKTRKDGSEQIYGLDIDKYIHPEKIQDELQKGAMHIPLEKSIEQSILSVEKEIQSVTDRLQEALQEITQKLSSVGVSAKSATKLDIEGADLLSSIELLRKMYTAKEKSVRSLLRLKLALLSSRVEDELVYIEQQARDILEWVPKARKHYADKEERMAAKCFIPRMQGALRLLNARDSFFEALQAVKASLHAAEPFVQQSLRASGQPAESRQEENTYMDESFALLSLENEQTLQHLLSLY